jgi:hypothetical protein
MPNLASVEGGDFPFVDAADPEVAVRKLLAIVRERIPNRFGLDPIRDIQVLSPMNRAAWVCARSGHFPGHRAPARLRTSRAQSFERRPAQMGVCRSL